MPKYNVFFDLDGTLIDTRCGTHLALKKTFYDLGYDTPTNLDKFLGPPLSVSLKSIIDASEITEFRKRFVSNFIKVGIENTELYDGILLAIEQVRYKSLTTNIITNRLDTVALSIIDHHSITHLFDKIYGKTEDTEALCKAESLKRILKKEKFEHIVLIGDTIEDIKAAKTNNAYCIYAAYGYGEPKENLKKRSDSYINHPTEIKNIYNNISIL